MPISFAHVVCHERLGDDHLAGRAIERVVEAVAVGEHHDLARLSADGEIGEDRHLGRVPVVHVVRRELVVPLELAGVGVERDAASSCRGCRPRGSSLW